MLRKIKDFLYRVVHTSGRLFDFTAHLGPFQISLWVGREDPDSVRFKIEGDFNYSPYAADPSLTVEVEVGVIVVQLYLTKSPPE